MTTPTPTTAAPDTASGPAAGLDQGGDPTGVPVTLRVALTEGGDAEWEVYAELFRPDGPVPDTVQLLVPGFTYDHRYWTIPGRYHYAAAMVRAGYAVLALDRIGTGRSGRPPAAEVTAASNTAVLHQVVQALRSGAAGGHPFAKVVTVGHSYGAGVALMEAARHHDVDGLVVTGMLHTTAPLHAKARELFHQASEDPMLAATDPPKDYATHRPGFRSRLLEAPGKVEPAVSEHNELIKSTATIGEGDTLAETYQVEHSRAVDVPTLIVVGALDQLFSAGEGSGPAEAEAVLQRERACFAPAAQLEIAVIPDTGHALTIHPTAPEFFETVREWMDRKVLPAAANPGATRQAILDATLALCRQVPPVRVDVAAIAERAGVAEQEVLDRWPSAELAVLDALRVEVAPALVFPDTGDFEADLRAQLAAIARVFGHPAIGPRLVALASAAGRDPALARAFQERVFRPNRKLSSSRFEGARAAGQLRPDVDVDTAVDLAFAPLWFRLLLGTAPLTEEYATAVADVALTGLRPRG